MTKSSTSCSTKKVNNVILAPFFFLNNGKLLYSQKVLHFFLLTTPNKFQFRRLYSAVVMLYLQMKLREWIFWRQFKILCGLTTCPISIARRSERKLKDSDSFTESVITEIESFLTTLWAETSVNLSHH